MSGDYQIGARPRVSPPALDRPDRRTESPSALCGTMRTMDAPHPVVRQSRPRGPRVLLAAAAGATVIAIASCGSMSSGNLVAPPPCDGGTGPYCPSDGGP